MREELERLESKLKRIKVKKIPTTFLNIINKNFDEVIMSKCMAFLLNPEYTSVNIIENVLELTHQQSDDVNFIELFNMDTTEFESIDVEEQISQRSRIDILIKFSSFWIAIENKINSHENNDQSYKYEEDLRKMTNLPIKFICLKPQYNDCKLLNSKFSYILYNQIVDILKQTSKYDFKEEENYYYMEDFIKHVEGYLMEENELISEDIEFYIDNRKEIDNIISNYKKQCEIVKNKLEELVRLKFGNEYDVLSSRYGYMQIWKKTWNNENYNGIHYEILCDFNHIIGYDVKVNFALHNESKTKKIYPHIKHQTVSTKRYKMNNSKNIEEALNDMVEQIYSIAEKNDSIIDEIFKV